MLEYGHAMKTYDITLLQGWQHFFDLVASVGGVDIDEVERVSVSL